MKTIHKVAVAAGVAAVSLVLAAAYFNRRKKQQQEQQQQPQQQGKLVFKNWLHSSTFDIGAGQTVHQFRSCVSGMRVVLIDCATPLVNGYFCLSTESLCDDGCPHTLEHLVFMGSELYPYKGVLDEVANRNLSQGTNAWTATDHTCYTLSTAGEEGFLNILPIYLDHILYPTITEAGFVTEVHHITKSGQNAGVVYCEMQGRENTESSRSWRKMLHGLFAEGCGYRSETGGIMKDIRELDVDTIRKYHRSYYRPDNLCLVIQGKVDQTKLFESLNKFDHRISSKGKLPRFERPWLSPVPALTKVVSEVVEFPSDDETSGTVMIGWHGPAYDSFEEKTALDMIWEYLTDSAISPLQKAFIEIATPLCGRINFSQLEHSISAFVVSFENVPLASIEKIQPTLVDLLVSIKKQGFDMKRIRSVIIRARRKILDSLEGSGRSVVYSAISDFLYGDVSGKNSENSLKNLLDLPGRLNKLLTKDEQFWIRLLDKHILTLPSVIIKAKPSKDCAMRMDKEEKERIAAQVKRLGEEKLAELGKKLDRANKENSVPVPKSLLESFKVPDITKVPLIPVHTIRNHRELPFASLPQNIQQHISPDLLRNIPFFLQFDHIPSQFVTASVTMDLSAVSKERRLYANLFSDVLFECPIKRGDKVIPYEQVVQLFQDETVRYYCTISRSFAECMSVGIKTEVQDYVKAVSLLKDALWNTVLDPARIKIAAQRLLSDIPNDKRSASTLVNCAAARVNFTNESVKRLSSFSEQETFLTSLIARLDDPKAKDSVVADINTFRRELTQTNNLRFACALDILRVPQKNLMQPWQESFLPPESESKSKSNSTSQELVRPIRYSSLNWSQRRGANYAIGLASTDSSFMVQAAPGIKAFDDENLAALEVAIEMLTALEGPLWKRIRGLGLSYSYSIRVSIESGLLFFILFKSTNLVGAFQEAHKIVDEYLAAKSFSDLAIQAAKSSIVCGLVSDQATIGAAAAESMTNYLRNVGPDYLQRRLEEIKKVDEQAVQNALSKYLKVLFDPKQTNVVIVTAPATMPTVLQGFNALSFKLDSASNPQQFFELSASL